jgi:hypothetical protein
MQEASSLQLQPAFDSRSLIIIPGDDTTNHLDVVCADPDYPGVNARVNDESDSIDDKVCDL